MCAKVCLNSVLAVTKYTFLKDSKYCPRALTQLQQVRERKRTCKAPPWFVRKKAGSFWHERELTWENRAFLQELVEDKYVPKVAELSQRGSPLKDGPWERKQWTPRTLRTGVLAVKIGVIPQWSTDGKKFFTTLLQVLDNHVIRYVTPEEFKKYESYKENWKGHFGMAVLGALSCDPMKFTKDYNNLFLEAGVPPKRKLTRFLVTPDAALQPGTPLTAMHFRVGDYVDVQAKTIGHGFQGVVKRWGFKGGPASHGTTKWHRRPGSIGGGGDSSRVWPGKKMPGHMGMDWQTLKGLKIWRINTKYNVLYVHGPCVPGPNHCYVRVMDTKLRYRREELKERAPPMPTYYKDDSSEPLPEEIFDERLHQFTQPTITYDTSK